MSARLVSRLMEVEAPVFRAHDDRPTDGIFSPIGRALHEQYGGKALASPMDPTLDRADGATAKTGDFGIGEVGPGDQQQRLAHLVRQLGERRAQLPVLRGD